MSLLIGIKQTHASGAFHGAEGFEGISMDGTIVNVIKDGNLEDLIIFAEDKREEAKEAQKEMNKIHDKIDRSFDMSDYEYNELGTKLHELKAKTTILQYDKLIIVEGMII